MAIFNSKGTISSMSEVVSGRSAKGNDWSRMTIMMDISGYQGSISKLVINVGTERVEDVLKFKGGDKVEVGWTIYAREWKEKWYNNVDLVNIQGVGQASAPAAPAPDENSLEPQNGDLPWD